MTIEEAKKEIIRALRAYHRKDERGRYCYPRNRQRPILLMGPPGIGKTAVMEQIARECEVGLVAYTITHHTRQSAVGLPMIVSRSYEDREYSATEYTMSEIVASVYQCMERTGRKEGILFIDEINCVSETLAPTMLQFLQNKTFGSHRIPDGWMIVAAGNPQGYNKSVREFDVVTLDRVRTINIEPDLDAWMSYAVGQQVHPAILNYLHLCREQFYLVRIRSDEKAFVTARGWEDLSEMIRSYEEMGEEVTRELIGEFLHDEKTARDFASYYRLSRRHETDYQPLQILQGNLSRTEYEAILARAKESALNERITVIGLMLSAIHTAAQNCRRAQKEQEILREYLFAARGKSFEQIRDLLERKREALAVKKEMELIPDHVYDREMSVWEAVRERILLSETGSCKKPQELLQNLDTMGEAMQNKTASLAENTRRMLEEQLSFLDRAYPDSEQEKIFLVSMVMRDRVLMDFISKYGPQRFADTAYELFGE